MGVAVPITLPEEITPYAIGIDILTNYSKIIKGMPQLLNGLYCVYMHLIKHLIFFWKTEPLFATENPILSFLAVAK